MANQFKPSDFSTNLRQPRPTAVSSIQPSGQSIGACVVVVLALPEAVVVFVKIGVAVVVELSAGLGFRCLGVAAVDVVEVDEVVVVIVVVVVGGGGGGDVVVVVVVGGGGGGDVVVVVVVVNVVVLQARANGRTRRRSRMLSLQFCNYMPCVCLFVFGVQLK